MLSVVFLLLWSTACDVLPVSADSAGNPYQALISSNRHVVHNHLEKISAHNTVQRIDSSVTITTNSTVLSSSGEWFEVSWEGVQEPSYTDWIGLYVSGAVDPGTTAPAKFSVAARSPSHMEQGRGKLRFYLISYRQPMVFAFMRGGLEKPVLAAKSAVITVQHPNEPLQSHLAFTHKRGEMAVHWVTMNASKPVVKWGVQPGVYDSSAGATSTTYRRQDLCGPPATTVGFVDPGTFHTAIMTKLQPDQRYYYVAGDEDFGWTAEASFVTPPTPGPEASVKLLAVADMGQAELDGSMDGFYMQAPSLNTTARMETEEGARLLLHNGDISYARGYVTQWDNFFHQVGPLASRMPYMTTIGNHERDWPQSGDRYAVQDSGGECGVAYELRTGMPLPGLDKHWYSFDFGPIHFLQFSTEHDFSKGSEQYDFIVADLAAVDRRVTPWLVAGMHRPMYVSSTFDAPRNDSDQAVAHALQAELEELFLQRHVDMTWSGHHHSYQRSCPLYRRSCQGFDSDGVPRAPIHMVIGHAGAALTSNVEHPLAPYWQVIKMWWGYMRVQANGTTLHCEVISDEDGGLMDEVLIRKPSSWGAACMARHAAVATSRRRLLW